MKRFLYSITSPTALTLIVGILAIQLPYHKFRTVVVLLVAVVIQSIVGVWCRKTNRTATAIKVARIAIIPLIFLPTLYLDSYATIWKNRIEIVFLGDHPSGIIEMKVEDDIWTDYMIKGDFRANPQSVKSILNNGKFAFVEQDKSTGQSYYRPLKEKSGVIHNIWVNKEFSKVSFFYSCD